MVAQCASRARLAPLQTRQPLRRPRSASSAPRARLRPPMRVRRARRAPRGATRISQEGKCNVPCVSCTCFSSNAPAHYISFFVLSFIRLNHTPYHPPTSNPCLTSNNSTQCKACPNRTFANTKGLLRCKVCQPGTKYDGALLVTATAKPCASCPAGTYRDHNRSETVADNECARCDLGKSSEAPARTCTFCAPGKVGRLVDCAFTLSA